MSSGWENAAKLAVRSAAVAAVGLAVERSAGYRAAQRVIWIGICGTWICVLLGAMYSLPIMYVLAVGCIVAAAWAYEVGCREQRRLRAEQQQPLGSNQPWTPEAEAWADAYARSQQPQQPTHRRVTRTVAVANRPPEAAQRPQETHNDVAAPTQQPTRPTLILPRYSGRTGKPRHGEDHGFFTIDDYRGFDPDLGE